MACGRLAAMGILNAVVSKFPGRESLSGCPRNPKRRAGRPQAYTAPALRARVQYKLVILRADGRADWEAGWNREVVLPTDPNEPSPVLRDAFRY